MLESSLVERIKWDKNDEIPFQIDFHQKELKMNKISVQCDYDEDNNLEMTGIEIVMPDKVSSLVWFPWPEGMDKPVFDENATYHDISTPKGAVPQPRRTLCYEKRYKYSGRWHPVEPTTPDDVKNLLRVTTNLYHAKKKKHGTAMCLANDYRNMHEHINEHSDNEDQFGNLNDVVCWVVGATRMIVIKQKKGPKLMTVHLPEGLYIMCGRSFQTNYTHAIPREYEKEFEKFITYINKSKMSKLEQAAWMSENPKKTVKLLGSSKEFNKWNQRRTSYTIRFFA